MLLSTQIESIELDSAHLYKGKLILRAERIWRVIVLFIRPPARIAKQCASFWACATQWSGNLGASPGDVVMPYTESEHLSAAQLKRLCGVSRETFGEMAEVLRPHLERQGRRGGQTKLSVEDQLLVALEYWREYRS